MEILKQYLNYNNQELQELKEYLSYNKPARRAGSEQTAALLEIFQRGEQRTLGGSENILSQADDVIFGYVERELDRGQNCGCLSCERNYVGLLAWYFSDILNP